MFKLVSCLSRRHRVWYNKRSIRLKHEFSPTPGRTRVLHHVSKSRVSTRFAYTRYFSHAHAYLGSKFEAGWMGYTTRCTREGRKVCDACAGFRQNPRETWDETAILKRANLPKVLISRRSLVRRSRRGEEKGKEKKKERKRYINKILIRNLFFSMRRNYKLAVYYVDSDRATCWMLEKKETEMYICLQMYL